MTNLPPSNAPRVDVRAERYGRTPEVVRVVADVHVGNHRKLAQDTRPGVNSRAQAVLAALGAAVAQHQAAGHRRVVVAGDLFDVPRPVPQLIGAVAEVLADPDAPKRDRPTSRIVLAGNHDASSGTPGDTALAALAAVPGVATHDTPQVLLVGPYFGQDGYVFAWWLWPFAPHQTVASVRALAAACDRAAKAACALNNWTTDALCTVVVSHFGVEGEHTPAFLRGHGIPADELDALCATYTIAAWLSGDWHDHAVFPAPTSGAHIAQIGALAPTGFDNPYAKGEPHGSALDVTCDPQAGVSVKRVVVPGPRFHIRPVPHEAAARDLLRSLRARALEDGADVFSSHRALDLPGCPPYVSARPADAATAALLLEEAGGLLGRMLEVVAPDDPQARTERRTLAAAVRSAGSLDASVATYVARHIDEDETFRAAVLSRVKALLAAAQGVAK